MNIKSYVFLVMVCSELACFGMQNNVTQAELDDAAGKGDDAAVKLLIDGDANINADLDRALTFAAANGHDSTVTLLIERGAVNAYYYDLGLCWAAQNGHDSTVALLIERGANVDAGTYCALRTAIEKGHSSIVKLLLRKIPDATVLDNETCNKVVKFLALNPNPPPTIINVDVPRHPSFWQTKTFLWGTAATIFGCVIKMIYESSAIRHMEHFIANKENWMNWGLELTFQELSAMPLKELIGLLAPNISQRYDEMQFESGLMDGDDFLRDTKKEKLLLERYIAQSKGWRRNFFTFSYLEEAEKSLKRITFIREAFINWQESFFSAQS